MSKNHTSSAPSAYQELSFNDPEKWEAKANLAIRINKLIEGRKLTQAKAADILGIARPRISDLKRGQLHRFSIEKLMTFLTALDQDVDILVRPKTSGSAHIRVKSQAKQLAHVG